MSRERKEIAEAIAIVGSSVTNRAKLAGVLPNLISDPRDIGVGHGLRVAEWDPFAKKGPK